MHPDSQATALLWAMRTDIDQLRGRLHTIDIALEKHDDPLIRHDTQLKGHEQKIQTLEQKITETPAQAITPRRPVRSDMKDAPTSTQCTPTAPPQQFDMGATSHPLSGLSFNFLPLGIHAILVRV